MSGTVTSGTVGSGSTQERRGMGRSFRARLNRDRSGRRGGWGLVVGKHRPCRGDRGSELFQAMCLLTTRIVCDAARWLTGEQCEKVAFGHDLDFVTVILQCSRLLHLPGSHAIGELDEVCVAYDECVDIC